MDTFFAAGAFLKYLVKSGNAHSIHSPFVFEFYNEVIHDHTPYYHFELIESLRSRLLLDKREIEVTDFGTGLTGNSKTLKRIDRIANSSLKSKKYAELIFRIINRFKPENIIELGTSFGITTLYMSVAQSNANIVTLEGCLERARIASQNFKRIKRKNIEIVTGEFDQTLDKVISEISKIDLVFFDGNHRKEPTLDYFRKCLKKINNDSVFIFDDIYWSREMNDAWKEIKNHPAVTITIDLYQLGIVFFDPKLAKQNFVLRY